MLNGVQKLLEALNLNKTPEMSEKDRLYRACAEESLEEVDQILTLSPRPEIKFGLSQWIPPKWLFLLSTGLPGKDSNGDEMISPLAMAAFHGHETIVNRLLQDNEVQANLHNEFASLFYAVLNGHEAVVKLLLASPAIKSFVPHRLDLLRELLQFSAARGHLGVLKALINDPVFNPHIDLTHSENAILITAAKHKQLVIVDYLLTEFPAVAAAATAKNNEALKLSVAGVDIPTLQNSPVACRLLAIPAVREFETTNGTNREQDLRPLVRAFERKLCSEQFDRGVSLYSILNQCLLNKNDKPTATNEIGSIITQYMSTNSQEKRAALTGFETAMKVKTNPKPAVVVDEYDEDLSPNYFHRIC